MRGRGLRRGIGSWPAFLVLAGGLLLPIAAHASKALPDLRFVRHSVDPEHPAPGQGFKIEVTVQNQGKGDAVHFRVEARRGQSTVGRADFQGLKPGGRDSQSISLAYPGWSQTMVVAPSAPPRELCLDLVIDPLKNANAPVDKPRRVCVTPRAMTQPGQPSPAPSASAPGAAPQVPSPLPAPGAAPGVPQGLIGPIDIRIASLDVTRGQFEIELENKDKDRHLRDPLVEVEINQAGKKTRIYRERLTSIPADGTRLLRIPVPKGAKSTDSLEVKVNEGLIGQKSLRGLLDEILLQKLGEDLKPAEPQQRQFAMLFATLQVNGMAPMPPETVDVPVGGTANLTWSLPPASEATQIYLRVREGAPFASGETCTSDSADWMDGRESPDVGHRTEGGTWNLQLSNAYYQPGRTYYFKGCYWGPSGHTGDETNQVAVRYGGEALTLVPVGEITAPVAVLLPDLVVNDVRLIRSGDNRGKLMIWVGARPARRGASPPEGNFSYKVYVVPSATASEYRDYQGLAERGRYEGETWTPDAQVYGGTGSVRNLGLFGYGDAITTDFRIPETGAYTVFVIVNPKYNPFMDLYATEISLDISRYYAESDYGNNHRVATVGFDASGRLNAADNILDLWIESHGPGWAEVAVRYTLSSRDQGLLNLVLRGLRIPGYTGHVPPPAGSGPTYAQLLEVQGLTVNCTATDSRWGYVDARRGIDRTARFLCRYTQPGTGVADPGVFVGLLRRARDLPGPGAPLSEELTTRLEAAGLGAPGAFGASVWLGYNRRLGLGYGELTTKMFPFGKAFTGSGAPSLPPQITLRPVQTATGRGIDYWQSGACIWAVGGGSWPSDLALPSGSEVLAGYRWDYDPGTEPLPCRSRWTYKADGLARFNLDLLRPEDAASLTRAAFSFRRTRTPVRNTCGTPAPSVFAANAGFEDRSGSFSLAAGRQIASGDLLAASSGGAGRISVDATALVRQWLGGERANSGFAVVEPTGRNLQEDQTCAAQYGDFRLTLEFRGR